MKTFLKEIVLLLVIFGFYNTYGAQPKNNFQYLDLKTKNIKSLNVPIFGSHKALKFEFLDNSNSCLRLLDGTLFFTGLILYCTYSNVNSSYYHDYSYRNSSLALMGIGICGGFTTYVLESNHNSHYGPRTSIKSNKNIQFSLNSNGLGLKVNI